MRTPICDQLGIEFPLFAFSHCRDVVVEVSKAGGFGVLGALAFDAEQLEIELSWIDEHIGGKPYGVDFAMPAKYVGQGGGEAGEPRQPVGDDSRRAPRLRRRSCSTSTASRRWPTRPRRADEGRRARTSTPRARARSRSTLKHPARMIVNALGPAAGVRRRAGARARRARRRAVRQPAPRAEAASTSGSTSSSPRAPRPAATPARSRRWCWCPRSSTRSGPDVPVLAAGGIGTGRQMAAALALGAQGAWTGSIWLTVAEADTSPGSRSRTCSPPARATPSAPGR